MTSPPQLNPNIAGNMEPEARFNRATLGVLRAGLDLQALHRRDGVRYRHVKSMGQMYA